MRVSYRWLREFIDFDYDAYTLADKLTMMGLEVDSIMSIPTWDSVVGEVIELKKDSNLAYCSVDIGGKTINIATADKTVEVGEKFGVVVAGGSVGDKSIEKRKFGEFISEGMFLSAEEMELEESSDKLFRLDKSFANGTKLKDLDEFNDHIIEIELTPNRGDALSILGIARDVKALAGNEIKLPKMEFDLIDKHIDEFIAVDIEDKNGCPRYTLAMADIDIFESPFFMRMRLLKSGVRSINNIVDITNYVLLALGQPLHAFDYNKLNGGIIIRKAKDNEKITALDGKEYKLDRSMTVIADQNTPVAIAGVMGGEFSSVDEKTKTVALESAFFDPVGVRLTARKLKLHTESSHRFERGVDPNLCSLASKYALSLMQKYANGKIYKGFIDKKVRQFEPKKVIVSFDGINRLLGSEFSSSEIVDVLVGLNFGVEQVDQKKVEVQIPTYRFDIDGEADIAEEIARIKGYDSIKETMPVTTTYYKQKDEIERISEEVLILLSHMGLFETKNYSFVDDKKLKIFDKNEDRFVYLKNPLIDTQNVMRTTLLVGLLDALSLNISRGARGVPVFEVGRVFYKKDNFAEEFVNAGFLLWGRAQFDWFEHNRYFDYYDAKGIADAVCALIGIKPSFVRSKRPYIHPGRSADLMYDDEDIGYIGELHPDIYDLYDIKFDKRSRIVAGEINLTKLLSIKNETLRYTQLPKLPTVYRDLSVVVDTNTDANSLKDFIEKQDYVYKVALFDVYKLEDGVSLTFRIVLRNDEATFTDSEIENIIKGIYNGLKEKFDAKLRGE
ncbi:phenylalanine--tRNA ligase subunit beta [Hippea jasoniae]|uniref:phenylalanine--tRNA ligase subunit beta n=1 Tax=Hippea jasoniae TaxID=944479 RepID=UPI00055447F9|nr:phenylalanine--tRNA ligase subunit beta [Hippea jasoniae]